MPSQRAGMISHCRMQSRHARHIQSSTQLLLLMMVVTLCAPSVAQHLSLRDESKLCKDPNVCHEAVKAGEGPDGK